MILIAPRCQFCGLAFVISDARVGKFCPKCSAARRKLAAQHFLEASGRSSVIGNYLLSEKLTKRLGVLSAS